MRNEEVVALTWMLLATRAGALQEAESLSSWNKTVDDTRKIAIT
jgi:hypothetical protein